MIRPKHSFGGKKYKITESFVDRKKAKELYKEKLSSNTKEYNILSFFGVGGVGKSRLRKELCRMHTTELNDSFYMYLDLNAPENRNLEKGILNLVDSCSGKISFKTFELAYALYYKKKYPHDDYGREKELISDNSIVNIGLNIIGIMDNGITAVTFEVIERLLRKLSSSRLDSDVKEELKRFSEYRVDEIEERLPLFFSYDIQKHLEKNQNAKVLIIFDTFEALNENVIESVHRRKNERWIQEIVSYFPAEQFKNLLVIIFGRDKITWGEDWSNLVEQYELTEFDDYFSKEYLKNIDIVDDGLVAAILNSSKGLPLLLYLMAETYVNMKNEGKTPTPKDFTGDYPEIIERFLYNLDKDTVAALSLLCVPNMYDTALFKNIVREFNVRFSMAEFEQFNKYSFVSKDENEDRYYIHNIIREEVLKQAGNKFTLQVHEFIRDYYWKKINESFSKRSFIELFFHASHSLSISEFEIWSKKRVNDKTPLDLMYQMQIEGEQSVLIQVIGSLIAVYTLKALPLELINIYIDIVHLGANYKTAVGICDEYLDSIPEKEKQTNEQYIKMQVRKIHHSMFFKPVKPLIADAKNIITTTKIENFPELYNEVLFLIGGNLGILTGDFIESNKWLVKSMKYAIEKNLQPFVHRTTRKLVDLMIYNNETEAALEIINQYVPNKENIDSRYKIYLMGSKGEVYRKKRLLSKAFECFDIVEQKSTENSLPGWKAHAFLAKAMIHLEQNDYLKATEMLEKAHIIYKASNHAWGIINTNTVRLLLDSAQGKEIKLDLFQQTLKYAENMGYQYNIECLKRIKTQRSIYLQFFFL